MDNPFIVTSYMQSVYHPALFKRKANKLSALMRRHLQTFEIIAFTGSSGAAMAYPMSLRLGKYLAHVRKDMDNHFNKYNPDVQIEGFSAALPYCILDDFCESGATINRIWDAMIRDPACIFLYDDYRMRKAEKKAFFGARGMNVPVYTVKRDD